MCLYQWVEQTLGWRLQGLHWRGQTKAEVRNLTGRSCVNAGLNSTLLRPIAWMHGRHSFDYQPIVLLAQQTERSFKHLTLHMKLFPFQCKNLKYEYNQSRKIAYPFSKPQWLNGEVFGWKVSCYRKHLFFSN